MVDLQRICEISGIINPSTSLVIFVSLLDHNNDIQDNIKQILNTLTYSCVNYMATQANCKTTNFSTSTYRATDTSEKMFSDSKSDKLAKLPIFVLMEGYNNFHERLI